MLAEKIALLENGNKLDSWEEIILKCYLDNFKSTPDKVYRAQELFAQPGEKVLTIKYSFPQTLNVKSVIDKAQNLTNLGKNSQGGETSNAPIKTAMAEYTRIKSTPELVFWRENTFSAKLRAVKPNDVYSLKQTINAYMSVALAIEYIHQEITKHKQPVDLGLLFANLL